MAEQAALQAFQRLLADAGGGGQAKVDALIAFSQRTCWIPLWMPGDSGYRTLVASDGTSALPVFSDESQLREAAHRFGWAQPDGQVPAREVGARAALSHAVAHSLMIVIDVASSHAVEVANPEMQPLLTSASRRDSTGPFAVTGRVSQDLGAAVRASGSTPPPAGSLPPPAPTTAPLGTVVDPVLARRTPLPPPPSSPRNLAAMPQPTVSPRRQTQPSGPLRLGTPNPPPPDAFLEALSNVLREYPEVEWACATIAIRGSDPGLPAIAVRIDPRMNKRQNEILGRLHGVAEQESVITEFITLDDPALMRSARASSFMFFPWRR